MNRLLFRYEASANTEKEVILDENDELWVEMRHQVKFFVPLGVELS